MALFDKIDKFSLGTPTPNNLKYNLSNQSMNMLGVNAQNKLQTQMQQNRESATRITNVASILGTIVGGIMGGPFGAGLGSFAGNLLGQSYSKDKFQTSLQPGRGAVSGVLAGLGSAFMPFGGIVGNYMGNRLFGDVNYKEGQYDPHELYIQSRRNSLL